MQDLFEVYPALSHAISEVCGWQPWHVTGASSILRDAQGRLVFELTKPKHWRLRKDDNTEVGIGGIGGSVERGEGILDALYREAIEELDTPIAVRSATSTWIIYEQREVRRVALRQGALPCPAFLTVSANLYRQHALPEFPVLAIAAFVADLQGPPTVRDLFGTVTIPAEQLGHVFGPDEVALATVQALRGVSIVTQEPLQPLDARGEIILHPTWTGRSFQILFQRGLLEQ